jgi:hypothetical protein
MVGKKRALGVIALGLFACGTPESTVKSVADARVIMTAIKAAVQRGNLTPNSEAACGGGGTMKVEQTSTTSFKVNLYGCVERGITLDGSLVESTATTISGTEVSSTVKDKGAIDTSLGMCVIELTASVRASVVGAGATYSGELCGFDAAAALGQ